MRIVATLAALQLLVTPSVAFVTTGRCVAHRTLSAAYSSRLRMTGRDSGSDLSADGLSSLSVGELKRLLLDRGVDFRDCLEKRDLIEKLRESSREGKQRGSSKTQAPHSLSDSELRTVSTFERVAPSVAYIQTVVQALESPLALRPTDVAQGAGSGFVWDEKGHVVTNFHVVQSALGPRARGQPARSIKVSLQGSSDVFDAEVVGTEPEKE